MKEMTVCYLFSEGQDCKVQEFLLLWKEMKEKPGRAAALVSFIHSTKKKKERYEAIIFVVCVSCKNA